MEILLLAHRIPFPPDKGDKIRSWRWLTALACRYPVHLGCFIDDAADWQRLPELGRICAGLKVLPLPRRKLAWRAARGLAVGGSITASAYRDRRLAAWVRSRLAGGRVGAAVVFSSGMAGYCRQMGRGIGRVLDFVDADWEKWRLAGQHASGAKAWLYRHEAGRLLIDDRAALGESDIATMVSARECERFEALAPEARGRLRVLRNGVDAGYFTPEGVYPNPYGPGGPVLALTGAMDYWPNEEAVRWFAGEVLPRLRAGRPSLRFAVVGRGPGSGLRRFARSHGLALIGGVPDMRPYLAHATAVVAPLRAAIGVPNKVLEGMAMARPVIATPEAIAGLELQAGRDLLVAAGAEEFSRAVEDALAGNAQIRALGIEARRRVLADYDWEQVERQMRALVEEAAQLRLRPAERRQASG